MVSLIANGGGGGWMETLKRAVKRATKPSTTSALATIASTMGAYVAWNKWQNSIYNLPPTAGGLPFFGHLLEIGEQTLHLDYLRIQKDNNLPDMWLMQIGPRQSVIVINKFEIMKDALETQGDLFAARPGMTVTDIMQFDDEIFNTYEPDKDWRDAKKWFFQTSAGTASEQMKGSEVKIEEEVANMLEYIERKNLIDVPIDICNLVQRVEGNVIFNVMFARSYDLDDPVLQHRIDLIVTWYKEFAYDFFRMELCTPFFAKLFHKERVRELVKKTNDVRDFCRQEIKRHVETYDPNNPRDYLDLYLSQKENIDFDVLANTTFVLMPDAIDTMSTMMNWTIAYITFYPKVQARIQAEIDKATGGTRNVVYSDRENLHYLEAVIMEVGRVTCPLIVTGLHTATEDCTFRGYHLPKDQPMIANLYAALMDPEIYKDPFQFDPDRFLDENGRLEKSPQSEAWIPFGIGRRKCMGIQLTKKEMLLVLANLFGSYELRFPEGETPSLVPVQNVIFRLVEPFKTKLYPRKRNVTPQKTDDQ